MEKEHNIKRGVSLYSFQEEYFLRKMTLEDIIATTQKLDIPGVEIIGDQMIPNYPNISDEFFKQWRGWMDKYERTPVCLDMFLDWNKFKGREMTDDERFESVTKDIVNANKLGCTVIRVIHDVQPELLEKLEPTARKYNVKLALEIHAPSYFDSPLYPESYDQFRSLQDYFVLFADDPPLFPLDRSSPTATLGTLSWDWSSRPRVGRAITTMCGTISWSRAAWPIPPATSWTGRSPIWRSATQPWMRTETTPVRSPTTLSRCPCGAARPVAGTRRRPTCFPLPMRS